jgi:hypothetical protein
VAQTLGIRKDALNDLDLLDFDEVIVETTSSGNINIIGADSAVKKLKSERPHWFGSKVGRNVNGNTGDVIDDGIKKLTLKDVRTAEEKARKSRSKDDEDAYKKLLFQYRDQLRA